MNDINELFFKYEFDVFKSLDKNNVYNIISFLESKGCSYIEDIFNDYLDLFLIDYDLFVEKYNKLNTKYDNNLLVYAGNDMNILEEFYTI